MSTENLEMFMTEVATSEALQAKIGEKIDAEAFIALGAECGYEFTDSELHDLSNWLRWLTSIPYRPFLKDFLRIT